MWRRLRRYLIGIDLAVFGMAVVLSVPACFAEKPWIYLGGHALALLLIVLLCYLESFTARPIWTLLRHWYPALVVSATFREMYYLIPQVHPRLYDAQLLALDTRWFGDVRAALLPVLTPTVVDALHLCYWSYFVMPFALGAALYRRADPRPFRAAMTICVLGWYVSYLGYAAVPALGPYTLEAPTELIPQGSAIARTLHSKLLEIEWRMPNAFPSGHVLVTLLGLACAWRWKRRLFWFMAPPGVGLILATIGLRYHYVVDVLASFALTPPIVWLGLKLHRLTERWKELPPR